MNKKTILSLTIAALLSVGAVDLNNNEVQAAKARTYTLKHNAYLYSSRLKRVRSGKKAHVEYLKGSAIKVYGSRQIKGKLYYRVGKNQYIKASSFFKTKKARNTSAAKAKTNTSATSSSQNSSHDSTADFMNWLASNKSLSASQKKAANQATDILKGQGAPHWYSSYVKLGKDGDATSPDNLKDTLSFYGRVNRIRKEYHVRQAKVSLPMVATAMVDADYQRKGGLAHPGFGKTENLAAGTDAINLWMSEKKSWDRYVKKHPGQKITDPSDTAYNNSQAGHYLNLIAANNTAMGFGYFKGGEYGDATAYDADDGKSSDLPVATYIRLANEWLASRK